MSRYQPLWEAIASEGKNEIVLTFSQIEKILGFPIDHAFLTYKKEAAAYGYHVGKISMKAQTVRFIRENV